MIGQKEVTLMLRMEIALFLVLAFVAFYLLLCAGLLL